MVCTLFRALALPLSVSGRFVCLFVLSLNRKNRLCRLQIYKSSLVLSKKKKIKRVGKEKEKQRDKDRDRVIENKRQGKRQDIS